MDIGKVPSSSLHFRNIRSKCFDNEMSLSETIVIDNLTSEAGNDIPRCSGIRRKRKRDFKKHPEAPVRSRSAFGLYSIAKRQEVKIHAPETSNTEMMQIIAAEWKNLPLHSRVTWSKQAVADRQRYYTEMDAYEGPLRASTCRAVQDPHAPKRPAGAFIHFSRSRRLFLLAHYPHIRPSTISKMLGEDWMRLENNERAPFVAMALKDVARFRDDLERYAAESANRKNKKIC